MKERNERFEFHKMTYGKGKKISTQIPDRSPPLQTQITLSRLAFLIKTQSLANQRLMVKNTITIPNNSENYEKSKTLYDRRLNNPP